MGQILIVKNVEMLKIKHIERLIKIKLKQLDINIMKKIKSIYQHKRKSMQMLIKKKKLLMTKFIDKKIKINYGSKKEYGKEILKFKIRNNLRRRMAHALKGESKSAHTMELIGCSIEFLKEYIANKFTEGMSWDNYGEWHLDHIRPCSSFDLSDPIQQKECFCYKNLQPLWAIDNLKKAYKYENSKSG